MKNQIYSTIAMSSVLLLITSIFNSCTQEETITKATIETSQVTSVTEATAICGGIISADGGSNVTARGVCWSTSPNPTIENDTTIDAAGTGQFSSSIKGLSPSTTYFVRAYAVNKGGTGYGLQMTFTTKTLSITTTPIAISFITATSAIGGGNIISDGESSSLTVKARGVCWNTFPSPTIANRKTMDGAGGGSFTSNIDSLTALTTYYARAYATNGNGTIYGNEVSFTTLSGVIGLTTDAVSSITAYTASSGGTISSDGGATIIERGICWNTSPNPTTANDKTAKGSGSGAFTANITGLAPGTTYYVRTYAINSVGTNYGNEMSFTTQSGVIILTTNTASLIAPFSATSGGTIISDGGATITARGICWSTSQSPTTANSKTNDGSGLGSFTSSIIGLSANTQYYARTYAINNVGTYYGNEMSFTTQSGIIILTTNTVSLITAFTATSGGTIISDGGATVTNRGVCWSTSQNPTTANSKTTDGTGLGNFTSSLSGMSANTLYYVRAYATNIAGTSYGNEVSFTTQISVTDIDGNLYSTVKIGTQVWMAENLRTTKYNDGTSIPSVSDGTAWSVLSIPGYCWYNNNAVNKNIYGALYNWYTVKTEKLAPIGWHIPTDAEWTTLENYLIANSYNYDGTTTGNKIAKAMAAKSGWNSDSGTGTIGNNLTMNNTSGFASLPSATRNPDGAFSSVGTNCHWWSTTEFSSSIVWVRNLNYFEYKLNRLYFTKNCGFSVRCVKD